MTDAAPSTPLVRPAAAYALSVFAAGVVMGTLRVLVLAPRLGESGAVLAELPVMLALSFVLARWAVARWHVAPRRGVRLAMGGLAFAILILCELTLSLAVFGNTLSEHMAHYRSPPGWIGLAGQALFALMPALAGGRSDA